MKLPKVLQTSVRCLLPIAALITAPDALAQTVLYWDADPGTTGIQDSPTSGTAPEWNLSNMNWQTSGTSGPSGTNAQWDNSGAVSAVVGSGVASPTGAAREINVASAINLGSLSIYAPQAYRFVGSGSLNFQDFGTISFGKDSTSAGTQVFFNTNITGKDLFIDVESGAEHFVTLNNAKNWTGNLLLGGNADFFLQANGGVTLNTLSSITASNGTTLALSGTNETYSPDISISGVGPNSRGAIRISSNNITLTGRITLDDHAMISTQDSGANAMTGTLTKGIGESAPGKNFTKSGTGELIIQGASNYTGLTIVSPVGATPNGGTLTLDFANAKPVTPGNPGSIPTSDLLYNGVAANTLRLIGSNAGTVSALKVIGKDGANNSQTFAGVEVTNFAAISATSGTGGTTTLHLGNISRTGAGAQLTITGPEAGSIRASNTGLIGPWATYVGSSTGWAGVSSGIVDVFNGNLAYATGTNVSNLPGYTATSDLRIGGGSNGNITFGTGTTALSTVSMVDGSGPRTLELDANRTLRLGQTGGIQITSTGKQLTIGTAPGVGTLTAGTTAGAELFLSNFSPDQALIVNSSIANNAGGAVDVAINGGGLVHLAGNNTYTGVTRISKGVVQAQSSTALGSGTGNTVITSGAALELAGNISNLTENLTVNGSGIGATGVIRNVSGANKLTGLITLASNTRIGSDAGKLTLGNGSANTNVFAGAFNLVFGGAGVTEVQSRIATSTGTLTKDGTGTLILSGDNNYTGSTTINAGALRAAHNLALGTSAGGVSAGAGALELAGVNIAGEALTLTGTNASGALRGFSGESTWGGAITMNADARIQAYAGAKLTLDVASGNAITTNNASARVLVFAGAGDIIVKDPIVQSNAGGTITFDKQGSGTLTLQANAEFRNGALNVSSGRLILDYSSAATIFSTSQLIGLNGGTLEVRGGAATSTPQLGNLELRAGQGYSTLVVGPNTTLSTGIWLRPSGHFMLADLSAPGSKINASPGSIAAEGGIIVGNTTGGTGSNASFVIKDANGRYDFAAVANVGGVDTITRVNATTQLPATGGALATPAVLMPTAGADTHTLTGNTNASTLRIDTTQSGGTLDIGSNILTLNRVGLLLDGSHDFTIKGTGRLQGQAADAIFLYNYGTGTLNLEVNLEADNGGGSTGQVFFAGTGLFDWKTAATASGDVWVMGGSTVRLSDPNSINLAGATSGNGSGVLRIGSGGIVELGAGDMTRTLGGARGSVVFLNGDGGGFSAYGEDRFVDLQSGGASANLVWGVTGGFLSNSEKLILGSAHANAVVDFRNNISLNGGNQAVDVQSVNTPGIGGKISGNITDASTGANGSLTKMGRGILTLAGANSYRGITAITEGTLDVTGSLADTSLVTVWNNAKLQVRGSGSVSAGAYSLLNGSEISLELGATNGTKLFAEQNFSLEGSVKLSLQLTADPLDGTLFTLLDGTGALAGYANGGRFVFGSTTLNEGAIFDVVSNGFLQSFQITYLAGGGADVAILAVPEPGTAVALLTSVGLLLGVNRFRRRAHRPSLS